MANLVLTGQSLERADVAPKLLKLKNLMLQRKEVWDAIPENKKILWVKHAATKDPIMDLAWDVYRWLEQNFFGGYDEHDLS